MATGQDIRIADAMSDVVEGGATIAWRLLATLEGGSLLLAASALLAYTIRGRAVKFRRKLRAPCSSVAITNATTELGRQLKKQLETHGCTVSTVTGDATSGADRDKYDALVVVGAQPKADGLDGISGLISEDVYHNIKLLECLSSRVSRGGCIAWACAGADRTLGAFDSTANAFDTVLQASLIHVAKVSHCVPIWVGRCESVQRTADRVVAALITCDAENDLSRFSIRNAAHKVGKYLYRWLKITT